MNYEVRIEEATKYRSESAEVSVFLPDQKHDTSVMVYGPGAQFGEVVPAKVNWSGIGSCSAADALAYAGLIQFCAKLAPALSGPIDEA